MMQELGKYTSYWRERIGALSFGQVKQEGYPYQPEREVEEDIEDYDEIPSEEELKRQDEVESMSTQEKQDMIREGLKIGALLVLGILALGVMLIYLNFVLVPVVFSRFLLYIFQPFVNLLVGKKAWPFCKARYKSPTLNHIHVKLKDSTLPSLNHLLQNAFATASCCTPNSTVNGHFVCWICCSSVFHRT